MFTFLGMAKKQRISLHRPLSQMNLWYSLLQFGAWISKIQQRAGPLYVCVKGMNLDVNRDTYFKPTRIFLCFICAMSLILMIYAIGETSMFPVSQEQYKSGTLWTRSQRDKGFLYCCREGVERDVRGPLQPGEEDVTVTQITLIYYYLRALWSWQTRNVSGK